MKWINEWKKNLSAMLKGECLTANILTEKQKWSEKKCMRHESYMRTQKKPHTRAS